MHGGLDVLEYCKRLGFLLGLLLAFQVLAVGSKCQTAIAQFFQDSDLFREAERSQPLPVFSNHAEISAPILK